MASDSSVSGLVSVVTAASASAGETADGFPRLLVADQDANQAAGG